LRIKNKKSEELIVRYFLGILGIILFVGLVFGSIYFSLFEPNMNILLVGIVVAVLLLMVFMVMKKRRNRF